MNEKDMYMRELRTELSSLSLERQEDIIKEYLDYFDQQNKLGIKDEIIIRQLDNPKDVAKKYITNNEKTNEKTVRKNHNLAIGLIIFDALVGLWVYLTVFLLAILLAFFGILIIFAPYTSLSFVTFNINFTFLIFCLLLLGFGVFLIGLMIKFIILLVNFAIKHLKWLYWLLGGQKHEV